MHPKSLPDKPEALQVADLLQQLSDGHHHQPLMLELLSKMSPAEAQKSARSLS
jgi:hypothetical protein